MSTVHQLPHSNRGYNYGLGKKDNTPRVPRESPIGTNLYRYRKTGDQSVRNNEAKLSRKWKLEELRISKASDCVVKDRFIECEGRFTDTMLYILAMISSVSGLSFDDDPYFEDALPSGIRMENTFQLQPSKPFPVNVVHDVIDDVLRSYLSNESYQEELCREMAKTLSEVIKARVRELQIPRYRFICRVDIGQLGRQGVSIVSSFLWDRDSDNFCTCEFRNNSLFAVCTVFAIYVE